MDNKGKVIFLKSKNIKGIEIFDQLDEDVIEINLADNKLTELPADLSNFVSLSTFDISNNNFKDVTKAYLIVRLKKLLIPLQLSLI